MTLPQTDPTWLHAMRAAFGDLPKDYIIFDTETSGLLKDEDFVLQLGQVHVWDKKPAFAGGAYLNWVKEGHCNEAWLRNRMQDVALKMAERGSVYRLNFEQVLSEGLIGREVIANWVTTIEKAVEAGMWIVGHNSVAYDLVLLSRHVKQVLGHPLLIPQHLVFDTGMFEKARQLNMSPSAGEERIPFFSRVANRRAKVYWRLDGHCAETYGLWERSGIDPTAAHDAVVDCQLTHHLFEAYRELFDTCPRKAV